jgi:hypothetical protein
MTNRDTHGGREAVFAMALAVAMLATTCGHRQTSLTPGVVSALGVVGAANSGPSLAAAHGLVVVTWTASVSEQTVLYAAVSHDDGVTFGAPVRVNDLDGDVRVGGDQVPRVTVADSGEIAVVWTSKLAGTRLRMSRSRDEGRTFLPATTISGDGLAGIRGWASVANGASGASLQTAWLDGRDSPPHVMTGGSMQHAGPHVMRQDLYAAAIAPTGAVHEARVATDVCFCCKTGVAVGRDGATYVAWRHVYPTNLRDMAVAASFDGGQTFGEPVRVSEDHWQIDACPEDGPAIAADATGVVHIVWATLVEGDTPRKGIFYSTSTDRGRTFAPRTLLNVGKPIANAAHAQMATLNDSLAIAWDEDGANGQRIQVKVAPTRSRQIDADSKVVTLGTGPLNMRPALAMTPQAVVVAWTAQAGETPEVHVQRIAR